MPAKTKTRQPEPEVDEAAENGARDYTVYATKDFTPTMVAFADWLIDEVGLEFANAKAEALFRQGVALGGTLRMEFQRSDFWGDHEDNRKNRVAEPAKPKASNGRGRKAAVVVDEDEDEAEAEAEAPKPARRGRPKAAASAAPKSGRTGRGRKPAAAEAATADEEEAAY